MWHNQWIPKLTLSLLSLWVMSTGCSALEKWLKCGKWARDYYFLWGNHPQRLCPCIVILVTTIDQHSCSHRHHVPLIMFTSTQRSSSSDCPFDLAEIRVIVASWHLALLLDFWSLYLLPLLSALACRGGYHWISDAGTSLASTLMMALGNNVTSGSSCGT